MNRSMVPANASANPRSQPREARRVRTMALILSVIEANECPGAMTGGGPAGGASSGSLCTGTGSWCCGILRGPVVGLREQLLFDGQHVRVGVRHRGEVRRPRLGVQVGEQ